MPVSNPTIRMEKDEQELILWRRRFTATASFRYRDSMAIRLATYAGTLSNLTLS